MVSLSIVPGVRIPFGLVKALSSEISLRTKGRVYQAIVRSILLYGCETWPVREADERMLEVLTMTASAAFYA